MLRQEGERDVKARLECDGSSGLTYERRGRKIIVSRKDLPKGDTIIEGAHNSSTSSYDDVVDETYVPYSQAPHHGKGKGPTSAIDDEEEEIVDVEEIIPQAYIQMETPAFT
jgi:hypothetical protein